MTKVVNIKNSEFDVYIGRGSRWGNPFIIGEHGDREEVIRKYRDYVLSTPELMDSLQELNGKRLGCHCAPKPCHGNVLAQLIFEQELLSRMS